MGQTETWKGQPMASPSLEPSVQTGSVDGPSASPRTDSRPTSLESAAARYVENGWPDRINRHNGKRIEYCPRCGSEAVSVVALACGCVEAFCGECSQSPRYFGWLVKDAGCGR